MSFREKLAHAAEKNRSLLCVGLDPDPTRIPANEIASYLCAIVEATSDLVCAYKPNLAFYEQLGEAGYAALRAVLAAIPSGIPVIADAKRGDIAHTAEAYARAIFDELGFDASTVNPYLGGDSVEPFVRYADKGVSSSAAHRTPARATCRTCPSGRTARRSTRWSPSWRSDWERERQRRPRCRRDVSRRAAPSCAGSVPRCRFLCRASARKKASWSVRCARDSTRDGAGIIVNASRAVLYASSGRGLRGRRAPDGGRAAQRDRAASGWLRGRNRWYRMEDFRMGDVLRLRKPHPCGGSEWEVDAAGRRHRPALPHVQPSGAPRARRAEAAA